MAVLHTFPTDGTVIKLANIDCVGPIMPASSYFYGNLDMFPENTHVYRIITLGFSGGLGAIAAPTMRHSTDLQALEAERAALLQAWMAST